VDDSSQSGISPRRPDTLFSTVRRFGRLWGYLIFILIVSIVFS
jgi:hypothetical protein